MSDLIVPESVGQRLAKLGIYSRFDLVLHLPLRYEDETQILPIHALRIGDSAQVEGEIISSEVRIRPRKQLLATLKDAQGGRLQLRFIHFYPSQVNQCAVGNTLRALGEVRHCFHGGLEMVHPKLRETCPDHALPQHLTPVYPTVSGLSQPNLRKLIVNALTAEVLTDTLSPRYLQRLQLIAFADAVTLLHHPPAGLIGEAFDAAAYPAWQRLRFDELLAQQLSMREAYRARRKIIAQPLVGDGALRAAFTAALPFALTDAQQRVLAEISHDLARSEPMRRLLLGDVGSGKTVVAALAALQAIEAGRQAALMAPTEILAEQHYLKLSEWFSALGLQVVWLSGSLKKSQKKAAIQALASGEAHLAVGTHALFQDEVQFANLGLALIDEQHRFGVTQRVALQEKGLHSHQLMMSATPIPRTLAMSFFADLDVSVIDALPPGRSPIVTKLIAAARRPEVIYGVKNEVEKGQQAYWVCPLIEESETLELQTALATYEELAQTLAPIQVGLVHGRMKADEKAAVMAAFKANQLQVLVATTVIEVGVDVPNASLMVIEHAERMGLAQLHQLRGRVGRGAAASRCVLMYESPLSEIARARLKVIFENSDGFTIAQEDLRIRGPGEFLGAKQSGMPMLKFADPERDVELLEAARALADHLLDKDPATAQAHLQRWLAGREMFLRS